MALSHYILDEMVQVLPRLPRVGMTPAQIRDLADSFMLLADVVEPEGAQHASLRDSTDQPVLFTLLAAKVQYPIKGDRDLLALADRPSSRRRISRRVMEPS